jgi:hypothetical protein
MKYLHELDPDELREMEQDEYWKTVAELEREDKAMEKYYEEKKHQ